MKVACLHSGIYVGSKTQQRIEDNTKASLQIHTEPTEYRQNSFHQSLLQKHF